MPLIGQECEVDRSYWREELKKSLDILNMVLSHCRNSLRPSSKLLSLFILLQGHNKITCLKKTESAGPNYLLLSESYIIHLCGRSDL